MKISENKPHSVHLRLTDEQYEFCRQNAELMGVGVADVIRMLVNTYKVASDKLTDKFSAKLGDLKQDENNQDDIEHKL